MRKIKARAHGQMPGIGLAEGAKDAYPSYDFTFSAYGPQHVVVGYDIYIQVVSALTVGERDYCFLYVEGLPAGCTASFPLYDIGCCGGNRGYLPENTWIMIHVNSDVVTGTYPLLFTMISHGVVKETNYTIYIDPVPAALTDTVVGSVPAIPYLSTWESNMTVKGAYVGTYDYISSRGMWEGNTWYYDGERVFYQIADYTGNSAWNASAGYCEDVYKPWVLAAGGAVAGWRIFPHGLYMDYLRNSDATSATAIVQMSDNASYSYYGGGVLWGDGIQRETAYLCNAFRYSGLLGSPETEKYARAIDFLLGGIDCMFVSNTDPFLQPFYVGLMMEALIERYEDTLDPRLPVAVKACVDGLWSRAWLPATNSFYYNSDAPTNSAVDLNMLIAPAFAWIYKMTGDDTYRQRGDLIFEGGVLGADLDAGKQFSQNYRWSFKYVEWRLNPNG